jgi:hypothetical protein
MQHRIIRPDVYVTSTRAPDGTKVGGDSRILAELREAYSSMNSEIDKPSEKIAPFVDWKCKEPPRQTYNLQDKALLDHEARWKARKQKPELRPAGGAQSQAIAPKPDVSRWARVVIP